MQDKGQENRKRLRKECSIQRMKSMLHFLCISSAVQFMAENNKIRKKEV